MTIWKLTGAASQDLVEMFLYGLRTYGPTKAEKYRAGVLYAFEDLARFPKLARERTEFSPPIRVYHYERHYIIYMIEKKQVLVLRVVRDEADLEALFDVIS